MLGFLQPHGGRRPAFGVLLELALFLAAALALALAGPAAAQQGSWVTATPMPTPRRLLAAAVLDGKAYALGGCGSACFEPPLQMSVFEETRVEVYDPGSGSWEAKNPMPTILFGAAAAAPGNGRIYTLGGVVSGNVVQEYDPGSDSWSLRQPMPTSRYGLAAVALDGKIYAVGGNGPSNALEVYDPAADAWISLAPMPTARVFLAAAVAAGKIYAIGGSPDCCGGSQTDVVEVYDPATDRWGTVAPLPIALQLSAAIGIDDRIFTFGGFIPGSGAQSATFEYSPALDAWTAREPMLPPRDQAPAVALRGGANVLGGASQCHCQALPWNSHFMPAPVPPQPLVADLTVSLTGGALGACGQVRFSIDVRNLGPDPAARAKVGGQFSPELSDVVWTCSAFGGAHCGAARGGGSHQLAEVVDLPNGGKVTYLVSAKLAASASGSLAESATVSPPAGVVDPQLGNNHFVLMEPVAAAADLEVQIGAAAALTAGGAAAPYLFTVINHGPSAAVDTVLVVTLPAGLELLTPPACVVGGAGNAVELTCRLGNVDPGQSKQVVIDVAAPCDASMPIDSRAQVSSATCDPDPGNNSQSGVTRVEVVADYAIVKTVDQAQAVVGSRLAYNLVVTNHGPSCPRGVAVVDHFAPELTGPLWCLGAGCTPNRPGDLLAVVHLRPQASATIVASATIRTAVCVPVSPFKCFVDNTACVAAPPGADPDLANNCSSVATAVPPEIFYP